MSPDGQKKMNENIGVAIYFAIFLGLIAFGIWLLTDFPISAFIICLLTAAVSFLAANYNPPISRSNLLVILNTTFYTDCIIAGIMVLKWDKFETSLLSLFFRGVVSSKEVEYDDGEVFVHKTVYRFIPHSKNSDDIIEVLIWVSLVVIFMTLFINFKYWEEAHSFKTEDGRKYKN